MDEKTMFSLLNELDQKGILKGYEKCSELEEAKFLTHFNYIKKSCPG